MPARPRPGRPDIWSAATASSTRRSTRKRSSSTATSSTPNATTCGPCSGSASLTSSWVSWAGPSLKKGDLAKAEEALQDAVSSAPQSVEAHTALATLHLARRQTALAEKEFRAAADVAPAASPARLRLADFYLTQHRFDEARKV